MSAIERQKDLQTVTKRLVSCTSIVLVCLVAILYLFVDSGKDRSYLVLLVFIAGLVGGFVSIQQRLPKITTNELEALSSSWFSITLIPINGGIFALVLMLMFVSHIIQGQLFPTYPSEKDFPITDLSTFVRWAKLSYPVSGVDVAKLLFWSFVAGFSERFVPQIIRRTSEDLENTNKNHTNN